MAGHGIESDDEYRQALRTVSMLIDLDPARGSPDGDRLAALVRLIEQYEATFIQDRCRETASWTRVTKPGRPGMSISAREVRFDDSTMWVEQVDDGRTLGAPRA
ncbi:hypothetical protein [Paraburkholderia sp. BL23I1N1]|uniref:hypothetical protein n=1 Tax=Paraburkholderia sp. BL23I1N1 TaxID=1938802 RepID=UPI00217E65AF|nr:hypothetical protein [Paraburkholderia sp. BL23I1N1]